MAPTLMSGERVLAWTPFSRWKFRRGAIVTLCHLNVHLPEKLRSQPNYRAALAALEREPPQLFVKRIVGMPGDTVCVPAAQLSPHTLSTMDPQAIRCGDEFLWRVPEGRVFVQGDGAQSSDSVTWGPIPLVQLDQIVLCRFPTFEKIS